MKKLFALVTMAAALCAFDAHAIAERSASAPAATPATTPKFDDINQVANVHGISTFFENMGFAGHVYANFEKVIKYLEKINNDKKNPGVIFKEAAFLDNVLNKINFTTNQIKKLEESAKIMQEIADCCYLAAEYLNAKVSFENLDKTLKNAKKDAKKDAKKISDLLTITNLIEDALTKALTFKQPGAIKATLDAVLTWPQLKDYVK